MAAANSSCTHESAACQYFENFGSQAIVAWVMTVLCSSVSGVSQLVAMWCGVRQYRSSDAVESKGETVITIAIAVGALVSDVAHIIGMCTSISY